MAEDNRPDPGLTPNAEVRTPVEQGLPQAPELKRRHHRSSDQWFHATPCAILIYQKKEIVSTCENEHRSKWESELKCQSLLCPDTCLQVLVQKDSNGQEEERGPLINAEV